ncbi:MAG: hypothetical protein HDR09_13775 [Lachnospiraceae bacterium]|nr:hypothetical protein [Lachnospiraceae bacterium]
MRLTIQQNIPQSRGLDIIVFFAKCYVDADFNSLRDMLSDDVYIVLFNKATIYGIDPVLGYFKDWQTRVGDSFECEVRWSAQFSHPEVYFTSEKFQQAFILGIDNSKITRILFTPRSFSAVGFSIDETPYNVGFIKANAPKEIEPIANHYFCPICGSNSEQLEWRTGIIFKDGPGWGKKTGLTINASICRECNTVCEVSPDRSVKHVLSMTLEQQRKADAGMTVEELSHYVGNTMGNKKPLFVTTLDSRTNELSKIGLSFHSVLNKAVKDHSAKEVFLFLDKLSFNNRLPYKDSEIKLHVATNGVNSMGDESYFYIGEEPNIDNELHKSLKADSSVEAAWQIYLLFTSSTVMPVFWHGGYIVRDYIFDEASINNIEAGFDGEKPLECFDLRGLSKANLLLPEVLMSTDGRTADVYCTYWNDWMGLVRDHVKILFLKNGKVKLTQIDPLILFEYDCGILF